MQLALTIALTVLYVGLSLALGGVHPKSGVKSKGTFLTN
jgi:hypothetical protein